MNLSSFLIVSTTLLSGAAAYHISPIYRKYRRKEVKKSTDEAFNENVAKICLDGVQVDAAKVEETRALAKQWRDAALRADPAALAAYLRLQESVDHTKARKNRHSRWFHTWNTVVVVGTACVMLRVGHVQGLASSLRQPVAMRSRVLSLLPVAAAGAVGLWATSVVNQRVTFNEGQNAFKAVLADFERALEADGRASMDGMWFQAKHVDDTYLRETLPAMEARAFAIQNGVWEEKERMKTDLWMSLKAK